MKPVALSIWILTAFLAACGGQSTHENAVQQSMAAESAPTVAAPTMTMDMAASAPIAVESSAPNQSSIQTVVGHAQPAHRPFVVTADLTFRTDDVRKTIVAIEQLATQQGGFVVSNQTRSEIVAKETFKQNDGMVLQIERYTSWSELMVRIPREKAQVFLHGLQAHITLLEQHNYNAQDVASSVQHEILTAQREHDKSQALQQLNQQSKNNPHADRAQIINNQFAARERQDEAKIQQAEWQDKVDYATISLRFSQPENVVKSLIVDSKALAVQHRPSLGVGVKQALMSSGHLLLDILLFGLRTWFVWLGLVVLWLFWRRDLGKSDKNNKKQ
ncbi:DUF4349 domain-containing protein [Wielerella bovis]|uniref:DUF4349 domain-containing protein n=2 Tax=Wielerella bovis TaxID=2917790 RepID=UPI00201994B4|nr:DUF4349 domain-containing protein [Wielerella bovis]ULJ64629.1 DUF4349 domain-containing protein [Wielerella bovis]ULJ66901.1 DUF4349 domain-containing protein [Wielerella bovis]